ncbi:MAG: hypothetical protein FJ137_09900 [Deltaproteobacteria bacterium]|nr:hypothetical protein [Deltaproteobacteria bacterium]
MGAGDTGVHDWDGADHGDAARVPGRRGARARLDVGGGVDRGRGAGGGGVDDGGAVVDDGGAVVHRGGVGGAGAQGERSKVEREHPAILARAPGPRASRYAGLQARDAFLAVGG